MQGFKKSASVALFSIVFSTVAFAQFDGPALSGQLIFGNRGYDCQYCEVRLESGGIPAGVTYADSLGNFRFEGVRPGSYVIRVSLPEFEEVRQAVEVMPIGNVMTMVMLNRNGDEVNPESPHIVDVSQLVEIPKKARDLYKKGLTKGSNSHRSGFLRRAQPPRNSVPGFEPLRRSGNGLSSRSRPESNHRRTAGPSERSLYRRKSAGTRPRSFGRSGEERLPLGTGLLQPRLCPI
jgi:hypothetical protein